jgi:CRP/FNR family transcriptional regulator
MFVDCIDCPLRRSSAFRPMSEEELAFVRHAKIDQRDIPRGSEILAEGDRNGSIYTLYSGWAFRYVMLRPDCRQILDILLPGDLMGLQAQMAGGLRHSVRSVTDVSICHLDQIRFQGMFATLPSLSEALVATLLMEEQRADTRMMMLGRQRPTERLAFFFLELRERLLRRGFDAAEQFELPLTYEHLADALGLSRSQIGSSLREIRQRGWASLNDGMLSFQDEGAMAEKSRYRGMPDPALRALI